MITPAIKEFTQTRRALITGAAGYIGSRLATRLVACGWHVTRLARAGTDFSPGCDEHTTNIEGDIRDPDVWLRSAGAMDVIFHLAGQTSTYVANEDPLADEHCNVRPIIQLLETCRRQGWKPFIALAGTVTVIGLPNQLPVTEEGNYQPVTAYDLHKWMAEEYLKMYCRLGYARGVTLRLANVYGASSRSSRPDRGVLNTMIVRALAGQPLTVYGSGDGLRDYIHVDDVVNAFVSAIEHYQAVSGRHWIIASGKGYSVREAFHLVSDRVAQRTGLRVAVEHVEPPAGLSPIEERNFVGDFSGFHKATGWQPSIGLKEGIDQTIDAFLKRELSL